MALTSPLKIYKRKATGSGTDKFDEVCLDASNFKVTSLNSYVGVFDDVNDSFTAQYRPNNAINNTWDCDLYLFGTGFSIVDSNDDTNYHRYSLPDHSGTFAMTNDIGLDVLDLRGQS